MPKTKKLNSIVSKSFIAVAVVIMLISVMSSGGVERNTHVSNGNSKSMIGKIYKVTKITLSCNIRKLVLK